MASENKQINKYATTILTVVFVFSSLGIFISMPIHIAQAAGNTGKTYTLLEPLPCIAGSGQNCVSGQVKTLNLEDYFQYVFNLLIALSAVAAVFMMVWGGFEYMTSDAWQKKSEGLEKFKNAIVGLLMVLSAFLILKTVNPKLVAIPTSIPAIKVDSSLLQSPLDLFNQLNQEAVKYNALGQQYVDDAKKAKDNVAQLLQQKTDLQEKLDKVPLDEVIERAPLELQIAQIDSEMRTSQGNAVVSNKKSIINSGGLSRSFQDFSLQALNGNLNADTIDKEVQSGEDFIESQRNQGIKTLNELNINDTNLVNDLNKEAEKAKITLQLKGVDAKAGIESTSIWWLPGLDVHQTSGSGLFGGFNTLESYKDNLSLELGTIAKEINNNVTDEKTKNELLDQYKVVKEHIKGLK
jgi:hypothetical protein